MRKSVLRDKVLESVNAAGRWLKRAEVAKAVNRSAPSVGNHLRQLEEEGSIQAIGERKHRLYGALGLALPVGAEPAPAKPRKNGAKKTARNLGELGSASPARPPAIAEARAPTALVGDPCCAIEDTGAFAINDGKSTIRLSRAGIAKVVKFLELTQHVWKDAA